VNLDATILAQAPKFAPYREQMCQNIAEALQVSLSQISVKATTEEGLGFTGEKLGIAAHAIVMIESIEK